MPCSRSGRRHSPSPSSNFRRGGSARSSVRIFRGRRAASSRSKPPGVSPPTVGRLLGKVDASFRSALVSSETCAWAARARLARARGAAALRAPGESNWASRPRQGLARPRQIVVTTPPARVRFRLEHVRRPAAVHAVGEFERAMPERRLDQSRVVAAPLIKTLVE